MRDQAFKRMVGKRIKKARIEARIARSVLGEFIGRSAQTIHMYEAGERLPSAHAIYNLSINLGVTTDYLFGLED